MIKISTLPWRSELFSVGIISILFGLGGQIFLYVKSVPNLEDLASVTGTLAKIEKWHAKNSHGLDIFLTNGESESRINMGYCKKSSSRLSLGDFVTVSYIPTTLARVKGRAMQITANNQTVCSYEYAANAVERSIIVDKYLSYFCLLVGPLMALGGYKKHNKSLKRDSRPDRPPAA